VRAWKHQVRFDKVVIDAIHGQIHCCVFRYA
jgi:hypothetical protein